MTLLEQVTPFISFIPFGILGILLFIQLYYLIFVYGKLAGYRVKSFQEATPQPPVSVIICAHNEQENIKTFLPGILEQEYPDFQVVVVNDCSTDDTEWILQDFLRQYPDKLKVVQIQEHVQLKHTKKFAVTLGIKAAKHEYLVFTDADCQPNSKLWLAEMAGAFTEDKEIVLGYSPYFRHRGFLNRLIRFETTHTAMSYLAYALKKNAYMGVGRNLAYTKSLFFKGKGFNKHMHIKSGDDDLFVNHNATRSNVNIAIHPDSFMHSVPKDTWKSYYKQKARHSGASVLYKSRHKRMLATQLVTAVLFYLALLASILLLPSFWYVPLAAYLLRLLVQYIIFSNIYRKLEVRDLLLWLPFLDLFYYFYICINGLFNRKKKQTSWK
ncbi:glycosyltransferase [Sphingobacterium psychroaquaticum]|uniref:Glycosyltransferase, catalytic subunit of cellulose synthase and poly-beta-1,6-N-acetylglucosamine synthase n=1 Tax=Sphingobacterium psychroaquaticum TaxID=561061 RepID=A0A1X7K150_9SPHI|nr:glycosyltransferase [Sphingobacterium psychroaquaticum]SMG34512.1 Glycosyltransferase, catalytic subunit of cellulose synthase and poly-beta-1,6-N-acetylglucosamine synthase [Sphingobacterium psychroaquaticum]